MSVCMFVCLCVPEVPGRIISKHVIRLDMVCCPSNLMYVLDDEECLSEVPV
jgi:hypothetical protein